MLFPMVFCNSIVILSYLLQYSCHNDFNKNSFKNVELQIALTPRINPEYLIGYILLSQCDFFVTLYKQMGPIGKFDFFLKYIKMK